MGKRPGWAGTANANAAGGLPFSTPMRAVWPAVVTKSAAVVPDVSLNFQ
jgi:hypothetical protein